MNILSEGKGLSISIPLKREEDSFFCELYLGWHTTEELIKKKSHYLSCIEKKIYQQFLHEPKKMSYLLGRYCGKQAISKYIHNDDLSYWTIENGVFGQPIICTPMNNEFIEISISHSLQYGAALVFPLGHPMGIDIEHVDRADNEKLIFNYCTQQEKIYILEKVDNEQIASLILWTAKEGLSKVMKTGLMLDFKLIEIDQVEKYDGYVQSYFKNFVQYKCISWQMDNLIISMIFPRKTLFDVTTKWRELFGDLRTKV